jgi:glycosyltransferase involved in cell wall biosynthesis
VKEQSHRHWEAYVTVDPCADGTYTQVLRAAAGDPRIHVYRNDKRRYSMFNIVQTIERSNADAEDVIVILDGDDWFADKDALRIIAETYERFECWVTYGSWLSNVEGPGGRRDGLWPAYPDGTNDFRRNRFLGTAVRTWKKWLWDHLNDSDLRGDSGEYVRVSEDQVIMIPLLEMSGTSRAKHIAAPIMIYNKLVKYPIDDEITQEGLRNCSLIDRRPPYPRLERKVYVAKTAMAG